MRADDIQGARYLFNTVAAKIFGEYTEIVKTLVRLGLGLPPIPPSLPKKCAF